MNTQSPSPQPGFDPRIIPAYYRDDEISLVDLWLAIARRKKLVLSVFAVILVIGLIAAGLMPKTYTYTTAIEISKYWNGSEFTLLESPETVVSKLDNIYVPQVTLNANKDAPLEIKVESPKNSPAVLIKSKGTEAKAEMQRDIHERIVHAIAEEHAQRLSVLRNIYESQLKVAKSEVAVLEAASTEGTITLLLDKKRQIDDLSSRLEGMTSTDASQLATRSSKSTGASKALILALSVFLGLFTGLFAAFIAEFRDKVIERMAEQDQGSQTADL